VKTYTYSEARQQLAGLLDAATREGEARIRRRDGRVFVVQPARSKKSPLDVPGVQTDVTLDEILGFVREGREAGLPNKRLLLSAPVPRAERLRRPKKSTASPRRAK
jgi:hypothetical protein